MTKAVMYQWLLRYRRLGPRIRGFWLRGYILLMGGRCERGLRVDAGLFLKYPPHAGIQIGKNVVLGRNITLDIPVGGRLVLGNGVKLTKDVLIAAVDLVEIGEQTQVAEYTSIRDSDHGTEVNKPIIEQPLVSSPVIIGNDVWLARGVAILRGSIIGNGAVIGANAVVKGPIEANAIAVGQPARLLRYRS